MELLGWVFYLERLGCAENLEAALALHRQGTAATAWAQMQSNLHTST